MLWMAVLIGCNDPTPSTGDTAPPLDLAAPLADGEVRAGVVLDEAALFGGAAAEGQVGDVKLYNSRVQFIIQGDRPSSYYIGYGGGLIDADIVRDGQPGRDILDEFAIMAGLGRLLVPEEITVLSDGSGGDAAEVLVRGRGGPMTLLTGTVENPDLIPEADVAMTVCYRLEPDSDLLEVEATIRWQDSETSLQLGAFAMLSDDVSAPYHPGAGLGEGADSPAWLGVEADRGEVSMAIFPDDADGFSPSVLQDLLSAVGPILAGFSPSVPVEEGDTLTWRGYIGVGSDLAQLSGAWLDRTDQTSQTIGGSVTAAGAPVPGARVHLLDDSGAPVTMTRTDADGRFSASVPEGAVSTAVATGRGPAHHFDIPAGASWYPPLAAGAVRDEALASIADGAVPIPFAEGHGRSEAVAASADTTLTLEPPGTLSVSISDGLPAVVRIAFAAGDPDAGADGRLVPGRPGGLAAQAWLREGDIPLEPGDYTVTIHRGLRTEPFTADISVESGAVTTLSGAPSLSYTPEDVLVVDPHAHAAPSGDGGIPMSERLMVHAANGVDVHFGTDHDNVADYRVLLEPLGLDGTLASVVAQEFSPVLRGHINIYPLEELPEANGGALAWWDKQQDTPAWFDELRERVGSGIIQVNHPLDSGMVSAARYRLGSGEIGRPDYWSDDFDTIEVINNNDYEEPFAYYLDMINRGLQPTPVGVSDSHGHRSGSGASVTFLHIGTEDVSDYTDDSMVAALRERAAVASTGPFIDARVGGDWAPGQTLTGPTTLDVAVYAPSWVSVDRLLVYRDGEVETEIEAGGTAPLRLETSLTLEPDADAAYVLVASGGRASQVYPGNPSWAVAAAIRIDADGDGWTPPWPAVTVE